MTKEETIKKILKLGFKEYTPNKDFQKCDRAWQKNFKKDEVFIDIYFWELSKLQDRMEDSFSFEIYCDLEHLIEQITIYAFDDFDKAYKRALSYIK